MQYAAEPYRRVLADHGLVGSMSRRGNPYDYGKAESFMFPRDRYRRITHQLRAEGMAVAQNLFAPPHSRPGVEYFYPKYW